MARARAIIVDDGRVALIERHNSLRGAHYYVFPGGGVEPGETAEEAARREVEEELGLKVVIGQHIATVTFQGRHQDYFLAQVVGGEFGSGQGEEMVQTTIGPSGRYTPVWLPIAELADYLVYPLAVALLVRLSVTDSWPSTPQAFVES